VNGSEFIRRVRRYARRRGLPFRFDAGHGKGSHGRLHLGGRFTTVKRSEISPALLSAMLKDLDIDQGDF
jgi:mRNA interferase HicA